MALFVTEIYMIIERNFHSGKTVFMTTVTCQVSFLALTLHLIVNIKKET